LSRADIVKHFPRLRRTSFLLTSPPSVFYNCIAYAAGDEGRRWWPAAWPHAYWPPHLPNTVTVDAFIALFIDLGYQECATGDLEKGFEKVAIFADANGDPTHAARQLPNGRWKSKLGSWEDIQHSLYGLEAGDYGKAVRFLRRTRP
jgi:hypothetical protein